MASLARKRKSARLSVPIKKTQRTTESRIKAMDNDKFDELRRREETLREAISGARCVLWEARVRRKTDGINFAWTLKILSPEKTRAEFGFMRKGDDDDNE